MKLALDLLFYVGQAFLLVGSVGFGFVVRTGPNFFKWNLRPPARGPNVSFTRLVNEKCFENTKLDNNFATKINYVMIMEKVKIDKMECRYPTLFKVMWCATVVWLAVSVVNYFGHWLLPEKLDGFGMSIIFLFALAILFCFRKGVLNLVSKHGILPIDTITRKVATYTMLASFVIMLLVSLWNLCGTGDSRADFSLNGAVRSVPPEAVFEILFDVVLAAVVSIAAVLFYWYIRMCFILFFGRIRRIGVECALALVMLAYLAVNKNDQILVNVMVVMIAGAFLYDIWRLADFQEEQFQWV